MATLVFHLEDEREIVVPVVDSVTLGSAEGNDVMVDDHSIAPSHAEILLNSSGAFVLRDLGSAGGTFVNGRRVKAHALVDGDEVVFGALHGRFIMTDEDRAAMSPRKSAEVMEKEYEDALQKHRMLIGVLQGLAGEENKRMANLERLQQAVISAESAQAIAEAKARKAEDEASKNGKREAELRGNIERMKAELADLTARHGPILKAVEVEMLTADCKKLEAEKTQAQKELDELAARHAAQKREMERAEDQCAKTFAIQKEQEHALKKLQTETSATQVRLDELKASLSACESAVASADTQKQQLLAEQERTRQALDKILAEKKHAEEHLAGVTAKHTKLTGAVDALKRSVEDMTKRQSEGILALRERERSMRDAIKSVEQCKAEQERIRSESKGLETRKAELGALVQALVTDVAASEARVAELDELATAREDQIATNTRRLHHAEEERRALQARVDALAGTEEHLLQARDELAKSRKEHAALIALVAERDVRQRELEETKARLKELAQDRTKATQDLADARAALEKFTHDAAEERRRLAAESQALEKEAATQRASLDALTQQLQATTARHEDLLNRNRQLEGVEEKLRVARVDVAKTQSQQADLANRTQALEKDAEQARAKLQSLQAEVKSVTSVLDRQRADEAALKKAVATLQAGQAEETKRLEGIRQLAAETERKAAAQRAELDAALEKRRRDIQAQEDQFHAIQSLREEIDALYAKIESSGENPAAAVAAWTEARKKKEELASLLPNEGGIRARPQVRTVLVPRSKDA